jgi:hypothetical protein
LFARLCSQLLSSQDFTRTWSSPLAPTPQKQRSYVLSTNKFFTGSISWKTEKAALISRSRESVAALPLSAESNSATTTSACIAACARRFLPTPPQSRLHPLACIEDKESIQAALSEVINALLRNTIEMKRATLILRALHIAVKNDARASVKAQPSNIVKEVPEYDETAAARASDGLVDLDVPFEASFGQDPRAARPQRYYKTAEQFAKDRDETIANYYGFPTAEAHAAAKEKGWTPYTQAQQATRKTEPTTAHQESTPTDTSTGRDSLSGCPGGPAVSVRSAVAPSALSPHNVTKPAAANPANSGAGDAPRKPPMPVKEALANVKKVKGGAHAER